MDRPAVRGWIGPVLVAAGLYGALILVAGRADGFAFRHDIHVGSVYVKPSRLLPGQIPEAGVGYDGQFYFVIAQDPFLTDPQTAASLDNSLRYRRLLYPLLAWLLSAGHRVLVPYTLLAVNFLACLGLIGVASRQVVLAGQSQWWAMSLVLFGGVWYGLVMDLTEPTQLFLLALGAASGSATLTLLSALAKETSAAQLLAGGAVAASRRDWAGTARWASALVALVVWSLLVAALVHGPASSTLQGELLNPPGAPFIQVWLDLHAHPARLLLTLPAVTMCLLAIARLAVARDVSAWGAAIYALICLAAGNDTWVIPVGYLRVMAGAVVLVLMSWTVARDRLGATVLVLAGASGVLALGAWVVSSR